MTELALGDVLVSKWATVLAWCVAGAIVVTAAAYLALRWLALRIARRVADAAERRVADSLSRGAGATGLSLPRALDPARRARYLAQIDRLAWLMDRVVPLPLVGGAGLDALLGLVPGVGDVVSFAMSSVIVIRAAQLGASSELLTRLVAIQCTDVLLGAVPVIGDLFDVAYQADMKSAALIRQAIEAGRDA